MLSKSNAIKNGLLIFLLIGVYFVILELLGLTDNIFLKFINFIFVLIGVNNTLKNTSRLGGTYLNKLVAGITTVFVGIFLSAASLLIYLYANETSYISAYSMTLISAETNIEFAAVIFIEGFTSSLMMLFILLQYWKNVTLPKKSEN